MTERYVVGTELGNDHAERIRRLRGAIGLAKQIKPPRLVRVRDRFGNLLAKVKESFLISRTDLTEASEECP